MKMFQTLHQEIKFMIGVLDWKILMIHISIFHQTMEMWCLLVQLMAGVLGKPGV